MTNELIKQDALDFTSKEIIATLKATVAQGLNDAEFALFAEHCKATGLNPFKKEVWAIKAGGRLQVMTGLNGFLAIANANQQYDGMEVEVDDDEKPTKAICRVYRKDRKYPAVGVALIKEYGKDTPIWRQMPRVMLTKVAKSIAIREAFPQELNGLYTQEEMPPEFSVTAQPAAPVTPKLPEVVAADTLPAPKAKKIYRYDITSLPDDQRYPLDEWMDEKGCKLNERGEWESPKEIKKLADYLVPDISPEAQDRVAALRARIEANKTASTENA